MTVDAKMKILSLFTLENVSTYIFAKPQKHTYTYNSQQFSAKIKTIGNKAQIALIPFHKKYNYGGRLLFIWDGKLAW